MVPIPWKLETVRPDDRTVELRHSIGTPACYRLDRAEIEYGTDAVTVTLYKGYIPPRRFCILIDLVRTQQLRLHQRLGGRDLVDGFERAERATPTLGPTP